MPQHMTIVIKISRPLFSVFVMERGNAVGSRRELNHGVSLPPGFGPRLPSRKRPKQTGCSESTTAESRQPRPSFDRCALFMHLCGYAMCLSRFQELIQSQVYLLPLPLSSGQGHLQPWLPAFLSLQTQICRYLFTYLNAKPGSLTQRLNIAWNLSGFVLTPV